MTAISFLLIASSGNFSSRRNFGETIGENARKTGISRQRSGKESDYRLVFLISMIFLSSFFSRLEIILLMIAAAAEDKGSSIHPFSFTDEFLYNFVECSRREFNHVEGFKYSRGVKIPLATSYWEKNKYKDYWIRIRPTSKVRFSSLRQSHF